MYKTKLPSIFKTGKATVKGAFGILGKPLGFIGGPYGALMGALPWPGTPEKINKGIKKMLTKGM